MEVCLLELMCDAVVVFFLKFSDNYESQINKNCERLV